MKKINTDYTQEITCPWCGCEETDSWEMGEGDDFYECPNCEKHFSWEREIVVTYSSQKTKYGTCTICGSKKVPLRSERSNLLKIDNVCDSCYVTERRKAIAAYQAKLGGKIREKR